MMVKFYFKKTWCGMVLMVLHEWVEDGMPMSRYYKATEQEAQRIMQQLVCNKLNEKEN